MDMERRLRGAWKQMSETHEPFSESDATANLETRVVSSRHIRLSHSSTDDRQQSMLDGLLAPVHNTNAGNPEIETFASLASLEAQQRTKRKRKKQRKKDKLGKKPHILVVSRLELRKAKVHTGLLSSAWNLLNKLQSHESVASCLHQVPIIGHIQLGLVYCPKTSHKEPPLYMALRGIFWAGPWSEGRGAHRSKAIVL